MVKFLTFAFLRKRLSLPVRTERIALISLLAFYLASVFGFAVVTPYGEAPDEHAHFLYIEYLARFGQLPVIQKNPFSYEAIQPPLYYMVGASVAILGRVLVGKELNAPFAPLPQSDPNHADLIHAQVMLHPPDFRWSFWVYTMRALSALMGLGVILLTYVTARVLVSPKRVTSNTSVTEETPNIYLPPSPQSPVPLLAAVFAALIPQANFIRASVSNENMADLTCALLVLLLTLHFMRPYSSRRIVWIGVALGLSFISKVIAIPFILPALWVLWIRRDRTGNSKRPFWRDLLLLAIPILLVSAWLYIYRWVTYGDPLANSAAHIMLSHRSDFRLEQLFWFDVPFRDVLWQSFWGNYGWQQVWLPDWQYFCFTALVVLSVLGGISLVVRRVLTRSQQEVCAMLLMCLLLIYAAVVYVSTDQVIWQGREMYPALSGVCVLMALGLAGLVLGKDAIPGWSTESSNVNISSGQSTAQTYRRALVGPALVVVISLGLLALNLFSILLLVLPALNP